MKNQKLYSALRNILLGNATFLLFVFSLNPLMLCAKNGHRYWYDDETAPFTLVVLPRKTQQAVPGQRCVFLVKAIESNTLLGKCKSPIELSVNPVGLNQDLDCSVNPKTLIPGKVAEVVITPRKSHQNDELVASSFLPIDPGNDLPSLCVELRAERGDVLKEEMLEVTLFSKEETTNEDAIRYRDLLFSSLSVYYPEFGIKPYHSEWADTVACSRLLIVSYHLFFNEHWEVGIRWHNMIPPDDWVEMYLRDRYNTLNAEFAFRIDSVGGNTPIRPIVVPKEGIWR